MKVLSNNENNSIYLKPVNTVLLKSIESDKQMVNLGYAKHWKNVIYGSLDIKNVQKLSTNRK